MPRQIRLLLLCSLSCTTFPALAIDQIKPGQWETTVKMEGLPIIGQAQLEQLRQFGIELPAENNAIITQQCISPEQANLKQPMLPQLEDNCSVSNYKHQGNNISADINCNGAIKSNGRVDITLLSDSAFQGKISMQGATPIPLAQNSSVSGKWVKAACDANIPAF